MPTRVSVACLSALSAVLLTSTGSGGAASRTSNAADAVAPARLEALSRSYLGTPYKLDCLGEGKGPDRDPLFTRKYADCQTLVEQVMAEAIAESPRDLPRAVRLVRYRDSEVRLESRHHYCIPDWLENPWPARDATSAVGGRSVRSVRRQIDRFALLASRTGGTDAAVPEAQRLDTGYIPRASVGALSSRIPSGSIAVFVVNRPGIVAGHVGFLFRTKEGLVLRHASQVRKRVVDEPLSRYLSRAPRSFIGLKVLQPDVAGLDRPTRVARGRA